MSDGGGTPPTVLQSALERLRLEGALFFRSELTEPFAFESTPLALADAIVTPYADHYVMGGAGAADCVSILSLLEPLPWTVMPLLRHGGGGPRTEIVCGYLHSEDPLFDPAMRALPPVFVVRLPAGPAAGWVQASIAYSLQEAAPPTNQS